MTTLVTGGTGLLGGNLIRELVSRGEKIRALVLPGADTRAVEGISVEQVEGDIRDPASLAGAMKGVTRLYHAAASVAMWTSDPKLMREINVEGTRNVLDAALKAGVQRTVYVSTVDALGLRSASRPADEETPWNMGHLNVPYVTTKHEAEEVALTFLAKGLEVVIVNPTYMLGAWDTRPSSGRMIVEVARGIARVYTRGGNNFVDVLDVADGLIKAMEKGVPGRRYILGNQNMTYREAFRVIAKVVGAPEPTLRVPRPLVNLAGEVGEWYGHRSGKEPPVSRATATMGQVDHYFDACRAVRELGFRRTPIERAIERAYAWFKDYGYI